LPSLGSLAICPKITVKTIMVKSGRRMAQATPMTVSLVAHRNIPPRQNTDLVIAQKYGTCFEAKTLVLRDFYPSIGHIKIPLIGHL
jgi:hypothetical protein